MRSPNHLGVVPGERIDCLRCEGSGHDPVFDGPCNTCDASGKVYVYSSQAVSSGGVEVLTQVVGFRELTPVVERLTARTDYFDDDPLGKTCKAFRDGSDA